MNARLIHLGLAGSGLLLGGALWLNALQDEAALSALFALACLHQAQQAGHSPQLQTADRLLFLVLRHLDALKDRLPRQGR